jgi:hypothetical protein
LTVHAIRLSDLKHVATATTSAGGGYSFTWYDDTDALIEICRENSTHVGRSDDLTS